MPRGLVQQLVRSNLLPHRRCKSSPEVKPSAVLPLQILPRSQTFCRTAVTNPPRSQTFCRTAVANPPPKSNLLPHRRCKSSPEVVGAGLVPARYHYIFIPNFRIGELFRAGTRPAPTAAPFAALPLQILPRSQTVCRTAVANPPPKLHHFLHRRCKSSPEAALFSAPPSQILPRSCTVYRTAVANPPPKLHRLPHCRSWLSCSRRQGIDDAIIKT